MSEIPRQHQHSMPFDLSQCASSIDTRAQREGIIALGCDPAVCFLLQTFYGIFIATYFRPRFAIPVALVQTTVFLALFGNFYRRAFVARFLSSSLIRQQCSHT